VIDPNIILSGKLPQIDSPLDTASRAMTLKSLSNQNQAQEIQHQMTLKQLSEDQALRDAYRSNMVKNPDGTTSLNQAGVVNSMNAVNPMKGMDLQAHFSKMGAEEKDQHLKMVTDQAKMGKELAWAIPTDPGVAPEIKQAKWEYARQTGMKYGLPNADKLPPQYPGDDFVKNMQMKSLDAHEQLEQHSKERDYDLKKRHEDTYEKDVQTKRETNQIAKTGTALNQVVTQLESARGNPAVQQAQKDIYAAKKFESLVNLYGDPNKLNPQQVQLAATEVAKMASGGVPSIHELQGLNPGTLPKKLAELAQYVMNNPQSAQAGEFVKALGGYVGALKKDAIGIVKDKYGRVIEVQSSRIGKDNAKLLKQQYVDPLLSEEKVTAKSPGMAGQVVNVQGKRYRVGADGDTLEPISSKTAGR
jgi:hypothetical protein